MQVLTNFRRENDFFFRIMTDPTGDVITQYLEGIKKFLFEKYGDDLAKLCSKNQSTSDLKERFVDAINYIVSAKHQEDLRTTFFFLMLNVLNEIHEYVITKERLTNSYEYQTFRSTILRQECANFMQSKDGMSERDFASKLRAKYLHICGLPIPLDDLFGNKSQLMPFHH